jgi:3-deoxy-manno-octulosonate cytidylyltransferase (CMP-KDO synthetase)
MSVPGTYTVAIIPARYASERLPGKPLAPIAGKPMIQHVVERTAKASLVSRVVVATDDQRIAAAVHAFGGEVVMTPVGLPSGTDRIAFVARTMPDADIVVNVQGDEPLIAPEMIDEAVKPLQVDPAILAGTLVRRIENPEDLANPGIPKVVLDRNGYCLYFSRSAIPYQRDAMPEDWLPRHTYYKHVGLYVFRRTFLLRYAQMSQTPLESAERLEQLRILEHGERIRAVITEHDSMPVDTPADLERVRAIIEHRV